MSADCVSSRGNPMHRHFEKHYVDRISWLRAAVLGANDGLVSTASLVVGVASAQAERGDVLIAGLAGIVAGSMSMAAGEYVSVSSQSDSEKADLAREAQELEQDFEHERAELAGIYEKRGLEPALAVQVADQLMEHDALGAHARDELGLTEQHSARPFEAAFASALSFALGAAMPLGVAWLGPWDHMLPMVIGFSLLFLALLGGLAARMGGARLGTSIMRVTTWGAMAMAATAAVGSLFGIAA